MYIVYVYQYLYIIYAYNTMFYKYLTMLLTKTTARKYCPRTL